MSQRAFASAPTVLRERERKDMATPRLERAESLATAAVCVALGVVLPFLIHPLGVSPRVVLPIHFPVFLGGMLLSPLYAALVGVMAPALSMGLTGMPTPDQTLRMMPELATYGMVASVSLRVFSKLQMRGARAARIAVMAAALLVAMVAGRLVYVAVSMLMMGIQRFDYYLSLLVVTALPGIVAQLILVPPLAYKLEQIRNKPSKRTLRSARNRP